MIRLRKKTLFMFVICGFFFIFTPKGAQSLNSFSFQATYHKIASHSSLKFRAFFNSLMSSDGSSVYIYGQKQNSQLGLIRMRNNGSGIREIVLPNDLNGIHEGIINCDGSRVFLKNRFNNSLYKIEGNQVEKVFDANTEKEIRSCDQIQTTRDGNWIYFINNRSQIWKIRHDGSALQKIVSDHQFKRDLGKSAFIHRFDISGNGNVVAAIIQGYWNDQNIFITKHEVFVYSQGHSYQITNTEPDKFKEYIDISGNGNVIAYAVSREFQMHAYHRHNKNNFKISGISGQIGDLNLNHDGSKLFYFDQTGNGGRYVNTDGSSGIDLFPGFNVGTIALQAHRSLGISENGIIISFRFNDGVYVGHINPEMPVAGMPVIDDIYFDPPIQNPSDIRDETLLKARISNIGGQQNLVRISTNELLDGRTTNKRNQLPIYFPHPVSDSGHKPDEIQGDGIYTSVGRVGNNTVPGGRSSIRIGVMDNSGSVVIADATLDNSTNSLKDPLPAVSNRKLSHDQKEVIRELGWPDTFTLYFDYHPDLKQFLVTFESWNYYNYLSQINFVNGEITSSESTQSFGDLAIGAKRYKPDQFSPNMDLSSIQRMLPDLTPAQFNLPGVYGQQLVAVSGDRILFGFEKGRLKVVSTTLLVPQGGVQ